MYYDLHLPCATGPATPELVRTLCLLSELGYTTVALSHTLTGKLAATPTNPLPKDIPGIPPTLKILTRVTVLLSDPAQNHRLPTLASLYDIVALRPTTEKLLLQACSALECDLISLDFSQRLGFHLKHKLAGIALQRGLKFEIGYAAGVLDVAARRNVIAGAAGLIRATRGGRGIIISSEAKKVLSVRGPHDVVNLGCLWGLSEERARETVSTGARNVVVQAALRRTSFKGVVDVVDDGVTEEERAARKRKAEETPVSSEKGGASAAGGPPAGKLSKKQRREAAAKSKGNS